MSLVNKLKTKRKENMTDFLKNNKDF